MNHADLPPQQLSFTDVPPATASRLGLYLRELQQLDRCGFTTVKSNVLGARLGLSDSQIRRDLARFGEFGKRGVGYDVLGLIHALRKALGTDGQWNVILIGLGNLGSALVRYRGFAQQGFNLVGVFEQDVAKIGTIVEQLTVCSITDLADFLSKTSVQLAILAVPANIAPLIARQLAEFGVNGILNFAPTSLSHIPGVATVNVDLAIELQRLAFAVVNSAKTS